MPTYRITTSSITVFAAACYLVLGDLAASALAKNIVVTTLTDTADPPFNADGPCGTGTISDLPGADGKVSLREAIIVANNTNGADTITFAGGGTIAVNSPLPLLCDGQTRINGDLNDDGTPAVTLEGAALSFPAVGIGVISSHNTITGLRIQHFPFGIVVAALGEHQVLSHTTLTDNELKENGFFGILLNSQGDHNVLRHTTFARNTISSNGGGILVQGGFGGADDNTLDVDIKDNTVTNNGAVGIEVVGGFDNSSSNHVDALIRGNTLEGGHRNQGIGAIAGIGAVNFPIGASNNNVLDVTIDQNTVRNQTGEGMYIAAGEGSPDGRPGGIADSNQMRVIVEHNTVENNPAKGIEVDAGSTGEASGNTLEVRVAHNTVCHNTDIAIRGEGGFSGDALFPPNLGTGNVLTGKIFQNTGTVVVQDGAQNGTPENTADVRQFKNDPCS